jgi:hypothetical protein
LPYSRVWHELLTLGFVKVTNGYVKKSKPKACLLVVAQLLEARLDLFDMVIADQTMLHMTGYTLAKKMLEIKPNRPILLCTG